MKEIITGVYAIEVPADAFNFKDTKANGLMYEDTLGYWDSIYFDQYDENFGNYIILGTVTHTEIDFDCEPYLSYTIIKGAKLYYVNECLWEEDKDEAFRSELTAAGFHFTNPYGKNRPIIYDEDTGTEREYLGSKWDHAQNCLVKKLVIIKNI